MPDMKSACSRNHKLVLRLYSKGFPLSRIANQIGTSANRVRDHLTKNNVKIRPQGACERNSELVLKMASDGCSIKAIVRAVRCGERFVRPFLRRHGADREFPVTFRGDRNHEWRGGRNVNKDGYILVYCPGHPNAVRPSRCYVLEHRLVMSQHLGRPLKREEVVHHINKNKADNRLSNLVLYSSNGDHLADELKGKCPKWTPEGKAKLLKVCRRNGANLRGKKRR